MSTTPAFTPEQLWTPGFTANPFPTYHELRERTPLSCMDYMPIQSRTWLFMRHDDVYNALRDHETFASGRDPLAGKFGPKLTMIMDDPPRHTRLRRLVSKTFTPQRVKEFTPWIAGLVNELLNEVDMPETDIMQSYAIPLPGKIIARLLGIPSEDYLTFRRWSDACVAITSMSMEERTRSMSEMLEYFGRMVTARRGHGTEDLITVLAESEIEGERLEDSEILGFCAILLLAGNETTSYLIGNLLNVLADRPELWRQLRDDRSLVDRAIEESVRYESPAQHFFRHATRDVEVSGVQIPEGAKITVFYGAANRDPSVFSAPDEFRLDRDLRRHVGFGMGIHHCLGSPLARAEVRATLNAFLDRFPLLERGAEPAVRQTTMVGSFGFRRLPLALST